MPANRKIGGDSPVLAAMSRWQALHACPGIMSGLSDSFGSRVMPLEHVTGAENGSGPASATPALPASAPAHAAMPVMASTAACHPFSRNRQQQE